METQEKLSNKNFIQGPLSADQQEWFHFVAAKQQDLFSRIIRHAILQSEQPTQTMNPIDTLHIIETSAAQFIDQEIHSIK